MSTKTVSFARKTRDLGLHKCGWSLRREALQPFTRTQWPAMSKSRFAGITEQTKAGIRRLRDAEVLRGGKRWLASMYLAGYAVECLLKAKLMRKFGCLELAELEDHLRAKRLLGPGDSVFSHQLYLLLRLTGALDRLKINREAWIAFNVVNEWVPAWRYSPAERTARQAADFIESVRKVTHWIDVNV